MTISTASSVNKVLSWTKDFKFPGIVWVILLAGGIWATETYIDSEVMQRLIEIVLVLVPIVGKTFNVGDDYANALLKIIDALQSQRVRPGQAESGMAASERPLVSIDKAKPNKTVRWLVG